MYKISDMNKVVKFFQELNDVELNQLNILMKIEIETRKNRQQIKQAHEYFSKLFPYINIK